MHDCVQIVSVAQQVSWANKSDRVFFRGVQNHALRNELAAHPIVNKTDIADIQFGWKDFRPLPSLCLNKYLLDAEGNGWSGRLKYLLLCRSVVFMHSRQRFASSVTHLLQDGVNVVKLHGDKWWDGLEEAYRQLVSVPGKAEAIAGKYARLHTRARSCLPERLIIGT